MFDPDHLSFSGTLQRSDGSVMLVRRLFPTHADSTWEHPFSGSPRPAETLAAAVRRCAERDLGIYFTDVTALMPTLVNRVTTESGSIELHPAYLVSSDEQPRVAADLESVWVHPIELGERAHRYPHHYSPLLQLQTAHLPFFGGSPRAMHSRTLHEERATG